MIRGIDHMVIACPDPDWAATELEAALGLAAAGGGRHEGAGTHNRIAWLADGSYLELIGVDDRDAARRTPLGAAVAGALDERGGGLVTYALLDHEIELTVTALLEAGSSLGEVTAGERAHPDGERVAWWVSQPAEPGLGEVPFLIEHAYTGTEWGPAALAERAAYRHPIGSPVILVRLDLATDDPGSLAARYHEQLGLDFWTVADLAVSSVGPHVVRLVPEREMAVPAVVTLGAAISEPRSAELLGLRFDVERVDLPLPVPG